MTSEELVENIVLAMRTSSKKGRGLHQFLTTTKTRNCERELPSSYMKPRVEKGFVRTADCNIMALIGSLPVP